MRAIFWLLIAFLSTQTVYAQGTKQITMDDLWKNGTFKVKDVPGFRAMKDGKHYTQIDHDSDKVQIRVYNLETGKQERTLFDGDAIKLGRSKSKQMTIENYAFSSDEKKMLLYGNGESIYRHSTQYYVFYYEPEGARWVMLDMERMLHATFSPDAKKVAFVKHNDLFIKDLERNGMDNISNDGEKNSIINGNCDWVYEEEFSFTKAFEWSPDGKYIAYYRFDESKVPEYTIAKYTGLYPEQDKYKYPKAGENNSVVQIKIYNVETQQTVNAYVGTNTDQYIPRITLSSRF